MRLFQTVSSLGFCIALSASILASQDSQIPKTNAKRLTNGDVLDLLKAGLSQEIVIAKISASTCEFDTSPAALKVLKTSNVPDAVILAMVQAHNGSTATQVEQTTNAEDSAPSRVDCVASRADPVPVYSAPKAQEPSKQAASDSVELFKVKCGDRIWVWGDDKQSWLKIRTTEGQTGYISSAVVSIQPSPEKKREELQSAADDLGDCRVRAENEYNTKMSAVGTLALTPIQRVYASTRLKKNLDAELKICRTQYESRVKAIEAE